MADVEFASRTFSVAVGKIESDVRLSRHKLLAERRSWADNQPEWYEAQVAAGLRPNFYAHRFIMNLGIPPIELSMSMCERTIVEIGTLLQAGGICSLDVGDKDFIEELSQGHVSVAHWFEHIFAAFYDYIIDGISRKTGQQWFSRAFYTVQTGETAYRVYIYQQSPIQNDFVLRVLLQTQNYASEILENRSHPNGPIQVLDEMVKQLMPQLVEGGSES